MAEIPSIKVHSSTVVLHHVKYTTAVPWTKSCIFVNQTKFFHKIVNTKTNEIIFLRQAPWLVFGFFGYWTKRRSRSEKLKNINPNAIKATMTFLADDLVEGRQPGTRGFSVASKFVETQMMRIGLKPAMPDGGYLQPVPLKKES
jgi:hypothetical protein